MLRRVKVESLKRCVSVLFFSPRTRPLRLRLWLHHRKSFSGTSVVDWLHIFNCEKNESQPSTNQSVKSRCTVAQPFQNKQYLIERILNHKFIIVDGLDDLWAWGQWTQNLPAGSRLCFAHESWQWYLLLNFTTLLTHFSSGFEAEYGSALMNALA